MKVDLGTGAIPKLGTATRPLMSLDLMPVGTLRRVKMPGEYWERKPYEDIVLGPAGRIPRPIPLTREEAANFDLELIRQEELVRSQAEQNAL